ncbi:MAG TPA: sensor histidine kinase [Clostridium sp.]|nr:sensor histidine kinase [Clostridium sp.]
MEIIRNPQEYLYEELVKKTVKLEDTIQELTRVNNQKEIIQNNYKKKTHEDKIKTEILANLSHEFKTPVNVIYAAIQTEQLNKDKLNIELVTKYNSIIKQNCNRLIRIINNFIDVNEFEDGNRILDLKCYNIVYITESLVDSVVPYAESKNLNIVFDTSDEVLYCNLDLDLFQRAILNLLSNAIKYTNIKSQITVTIEKINNHIKISIEDKGIGISEEYLNTIFNRFERVDKTFSRDTEGVGLGLNIAKEIIELHKGTINISSEEKMGTKVIVILPGEFSEENKKYENINITDSAKQKAAIEMSDIYFE